MNRVLVKTQSDSIAANSPLFTCVIHLGKCSVLATSSDAPATRSFMFLGLAQDGGWARRSFGSLNIDGPCRALSSRAVTFRRDGSSHGDGSVLPGREARPCDVRWRRLCCAPCHALGFIAPDAEQLRRDNEAKAAVLWMKLQFGTRASGVIKPAHKHIISNPAVATGHLIITSLLGHHQLRAHPNPPQKAGCCTKPVSRFLPSHFSWLPCPSPPPPRTPNNPQKTHAIARRFRGAFALRGAWRCRTSSPTRSWPR